MAKDDAKKVFEHLEKAREASAPLKDPGLTKKIETAQEHIKKRVDPDKGSPKGIESAGPAVMVESHVGLIDPQLVSTLGLSIMPTTHYIHSGHALCEDASATRFTHDKHAVSCAECNSWIEWIAK